MAYDKENTFNQILLSIEEGNSLRTTLKREGMPTSTTFYEWIDNDKEKSLHYARACEKRADSIFEEILEIADESINDVVSYEIADGVKVEKVDHENIQRSRLRVDARKWMLAKMQPKKYGDKLDVTSDGDALQAPKKIIIKVNRREDPTT